MLEQRSDVVDTLGRIFSTGWGSNTGIRKGVDEVDEKILDPAGGAKE